MLNSWDTTLLISWPDHNSALWKSVCRMHRIQPSHGLILVPIPYSEVEWCYKLPNKRNNLVNSCYTEAPTWPGCSLCPFLSSSLWVHLNVCAIYDEFTTGCSLNIVYRNWVEQKVKTATASQRLPLQKNKNVLPTWARPITEVVFWWKAPQS